jgi:hypothetical protein
MCNISVRTVERQGLQVTAKKLEGAQAWEKFEHGIKTILQLTKAESKESAKHPKQRKKRKKSFPRT